MKTGFITDGSVKLHPLVGPEVKLQGGRLACKMGSHYKATQGYDRVKALVERLDM